MNLATSKRALAILGLALLVMALNVGATVLYMVLYGHLLAPGHDAAFYDAHVQVAAPWLSIFFGIPLMFFAARWTAPRVGRRSAVMIALVYIAIDITVLIASSSMGRLALLATASYLTKLAAAWAGARAQLAVTPSPA